MPEPRQSLPTRAVRPHADPPGTLSTRRRTRRSRRRPCGGGRQVDVHQVPLFNPTQTLLTPSARAGGRAGAGAGLCGGGRQVDVYQVLLLGRRQRLHARQRRRDLPEQRLHASGVRCVTVVLATCQLKRAFAITPRLTDLKVLQHMLPDICWAAFTMPCRQRRSGLCGRRDRGGRHGLEDEPKGLVSASMRTLMLKPALALVSMNMTLYSRALASPSSIDTCLSPETPLSA